MHQRQIIQFFMHANFKCWCFSAAASVHDINLPGPGMTAYLDMLGSLFVTQFHALHLMTSLIFSHKQLHKLQQNIS